MEIEIVTHGNGAGLALAKIAAIAATGPEFALQGNGIRKSLQGSRSERTVLSGGICGL